MSTISLALLPRGKVLMVKPGEGSPINLATHINEALAADENTKGIEVAIAPVQGSPGNYLLELTGDTAWQRGVKPVQRVRALLKAYDVMVGGGIPEDIGDEQLLNLVHSGGAAESGRGRVSRLNIFINASILDKAAQRGGGTTIVQADPNAAVNSRIEALTAAYFEKNGDFDKLAEAQGKFEKSPQVFAGWLQNEVKKLGGTVTTPTETPTETPTTPTSGGSTVL